MKWLKKVMDGDVNSTDAGGNVHSRMVMDLLDELKSGRGVVQWDGDRIVIKPMRLYCLDLNALTGQEKFSTLRVSINSNRADYITGLVAASGGGVHVDDAQELQASADSCMNRTSAALDAVRSGLSTMESTILHSISQLPSLVNCPVTMCPACGNDITLHGIVKDADKLVALNNAAISVVLKDSNNNKGDRVTTVASSSGEFYLNLQEKNASYSILFEMDGYHPLTVRDVDQLVTVNHTKFLPPLLFIRKSVSDAGVASGMLYLFQHGGLFNITATIDFRSDANNFFGPVVASVSTSETKREWSLSLPTGTYTALVRGFHYQTAWFTVTVIAGKETIWDFEVMPFMDFNEIRIVLRGGSFRTAKFCAECLELVVVGPTTDTVCRAEVSAVGEHGSPDGFFRVDYSGLLMDSAIIKTQLLGVYEIKVYNWHQRKIEGWAIATSNAMVQLYRGLRLIGQFHVPYAFGRSWTVAEISGSQLKVVNKVVATAP
ncbi:uncharacterized protein LOC129589636 [Paramacrobiotus metropolitanus]|uniref:uncharacterized protein LOC129589636 n=1 Tax=Paramacrobiotus metropolitanus TaxID=2943436 RepID=UPI00244571B2|nr:uncharacterized protein LOC129589636 [Paramacrobiotus metropolitanus]